MNRIILLFLVAFGSVALVNAQATLPTSHDFNSANPPTGWSLFQQNGNATYSSGSDGNPSARLDETGDHIEIFFAEEPGPVSYFLRGSTWQGAPWDGTFSIQESVDGTNWSDMRVLTNTSGVSVGGFTQYTDFPSATSRYVRFYYTNKISGANIALDQVNLDIPGPTPPQEINITFNGAKVLSGDNIAFNAPVAGTTDITLMISNLGTVNTLQLTNMALSGPQSSEFQILTPQPDSIVALDSAALMVRFSPTAAGTRSGLLTIDNNDSDENPFLINLFGVGGNSASEPTAAPTAFTASDVRSFKMDISFTEPNPVPNGGYLVLRGNGSAVTGAPTDGTTYTRGDMIGANKVVYSGPANEFSPNNIIADADYHFAIFAYNGANQFINYLSTPLTGMVTSAPQSLRDPGYYVGMDTSSASFVSDLTNLIQPHFQVFYANYLSTMIPFVSRDTAGLDRVLTCAYSGEQQVYSVPFGFTTYDYSREHVFSSSWMPDSATSDSPPYSDQHNLYPTNLTQVNIPRSNNPLGIVVNVQSQYLDGKLGTDANGNTVYEPRDGLKGDAARAIFYMTTAYNGWAGQSWAWNSLNGSRVQDQDQQVLKDWHFNDMPDGREMARNDFLDTLQQNRNPFVDHPEYVCHIDFATMTKISNTTGPCAPVSLDRLRGTTAVKVYPNPSAGQFAIEFEAERNQQVEAKLLDLFGKVVFVDGFEGRAGANVHRMEVEALPAGVYFLEMKVDGQVFSQKVSVLK